MIELVKNIKKITGNTPLVKISDRLYGKLETYNPSGSVKDRFVVYAVESAIGSNDINKDTTLIEATSGNTGISLSMVGAALGLPVKIIMPSNMSEERKQMMKRFGAEIIECDASDFNQAIDIRNNMLNSSEDFWSPMQFSNLENIRCHFLTTAHEIHQQIGPSWECFIHGAGTGGTIMGVSRYVESLGLDVSIGLVLPAEDDHGIQGIGDGEDFLVNRKCIDFTESVQTDHAIKRSKQLASDTGLMVGISSGANIIASEAWLCQNPNGGDVVTILCDRGERYLSI
jgi:cysteine synthase A